MTAGVRGPLASGFLEIDGMRAVTSARFAARRDTGDVDGPARMSGPRRSRPAPRRRLRGLRVLDLGHGGVGVEVGRLLASTAPT